MNSYTHIDGSYGEGGGQIIRNTTALAHILCKPIIVENVRSGRQNPGLQAQHLTSIVTISGLNQKHTLDGAQKGSTRFTFTPAPHAALTKKSYEADTRTAGSCTLLMQAILPPLIFSEKQHGSVQAVLRGGTNVSHSPPVDEYVHVFMPLLSKHFGVNFDLKVEKRGFYPVGRGVLRLDVHDVKLPLPAMTLMDRGTRISSIKIFGFYTNDAHAKIAQEMADIVAQGLKISSVLHCIDIVPEITVEKDKTRSAGDVALVTAVIETDSGCLYGTSAVTEDLTKSKKKGPSPNELAKTAVLHMEKQWQEKGCLDEHVQDQFIIYCSLAQGISKIRTGPLTDHTKTAIHFCSLLTGAKFNIQQDPQDETIVIECEGIAYKTK
jgi:RNA 3'-terminal phosphate cyclase (ATP)